MATILDLQVPSTIRAYTVALPEVNGELIFCVPAMSLYHSMTPVFPSSIIDSASLRSNMPKPLLNSHTSSIVAFAKGHFVEIRNLSVN